MTLAELEGRLFALEKKVDELQLRIAETQDKRGAWWREGAGRFANDPVFDEIVRLGREYRESLNPYRRKKKPGQAKKRKRAHT